jgi:multiple sugar transport system ATP-binding protein
MAPVTLQGVRKVYEDGFVAVHGVDLEVADGEFVVLVGPSGCGKSTTLRMIAGLEAITAGTLSIGARVVNDVPPAQRDIAMVFQSYALYPHMTVRDNLGFALRLQKKPKAEIAARVGTVAETLGLTPMLDRTPRQLSGGQRQRVAIGRAIVRNPRIFLFDEPLSNLDAQLRDEMRGEIKRLHQEIATTMIYVTHDQIEAMTLADRIVLMRDGLIEQQGAPLDLFERPASRFVAGFLGSPQMSFLPGRLAAEDGGWRIALGDGAVTLPVPRERRLNGASDGQPVLLGLRPEHLTRSHGEASEGTVRHEATIELLQPTGSRSYATFRLGDTPVMAELQAHDVSRAGQVVPIDINLRRASIFDQGTEKAL